MIQSNSNRPFLIGATIFLAIIGIMYLRSKPICDRHWTHVKSMLPELSKPGALKSIELSKVYDDGVGNLIDGTVLITEQPVIEKIRTMLRNRSQGVWERPAYQWNVKMTIMFDNGDKLTLLVRKVDETMTHITFGTGPCHDEYPNFSTELGAYLEDLVRENESPINREIS